MKYLILVYLYFLNTKHPSKLPKFQQHGSRENNCSKKIFHQITIVIDRVIVNFTFLNFQGSFRIRYY
jgi:hypothetical protein